MAKEKKYLYNFAQHPDIFTNLEAVIQAVHDGDVADGDEVEIYVLERTAVVRVGEVTLK